VLSGQGSALDTTRADGRLIFAVFAALAEFERGVISERTRAGLQAARGRKGGRPRKMTASRIRMAMAAMADPAARPREIARELGVPTTTLYEYVNGDGSPKAAAEAVLRGAARPY
jgi:DNA invertase Pin-like site-specific DNA recombinase